MEAIEMTIDENAVAAAERIARTEARYAETIAERRNRVAAPATAHAEAASIESTTREGLAAEFQRRVDLQQEFLSEADFVAFTMAERSGKLRILRRPVASSAA
jgi:hypothetical protein